MGNFCSSTNTKCITMKEWLTNINIKEITTLIKTMKIKNKETEIEEDIYFYHIKKGELGNENIPGHINFTYQLNTDLQEHFSKLCTQQLSSSGINDSLYENSSLIICTIAPIGDLQKQNDKVILENIKGFCLCHIDETDKSILYIDKLCSNFSQGRNMLNTLETLSNNNKITFFGRTYNTIGLTSIPGAVGFYKKCKYETSNDSYFCKNLQNAGGKIYKKYKGRQYLVRTGKKNGKYIIVNNKKIYKS